MDNQAINLLLVEDETEHARLITHILDRAEQYFDLTRAVTMRAALQHLEDHPHTVDAILLDLSLPDVKGIETFHTMQRAAPDIPIVVLTGQDSQQLAFDTVKAGAQDYLFKAHLDTQRLPYTIQYAIERERIQVENVRRINRLALLRDVDHELTRRLDVRYVLTMAVDTALRLSAATACVIAVLGKNGAPELLENINYPPDVLEGGTFLTGGIVGRSLRNRRAELVPDVSLDPDYVPLLPETTSHITIPLISQSGLIGVIVLETHVAEQFSEETFEFLLILAARIAAAIDNARLYNASQTQLSELQELYTQVSALEQMKTDMIRIAAHDLRAPISNILTALYLLQTDIGEHIPDQFKEYFGIIEDATRRMQTITNDILSLERLEAMQHIEHKPLDLREIVEEAFLNAQERAIQKTQNMFLEQPRRPARIEGDPPLLYEAIDNLIGNAIKYTPEGGRIELRLRARGGKVCFEVQDTGYGIPKEQQERLFQPFFRAQIDETKGIEGTGLGLHLVKNIIERHHGTMVFHSEYGQGSTFGFTLPGLAKTRRPS